MGQKAAWTLFQVPREKQTNKQKMTRHGLRSPVIPVGRAEPQKSWNSKKLSFFWTLLGEQSLWNRNCSSVQKRACVYLTHQTNKMRATDLLEGKAEFLYTLSCYFKMKKKKIHSKFDLRISFSVYLEVTFILNCSYKSFCPGFKYCHIWDYILSLLI